MCVVRLSGGEIWATHHTAHTHMPHDASMHSGTSGPCVAVQGIVMQQTSEAAAKLQATTTQVQAAVELRPASAHTDNSSALGVHTENAAVALDIDQIRRQLISIATGMMSVRMTPVQAKDHAACTIPVDCICTLLSGGLSTCHLSVRLWCIQTWPHIIIPGGQA